MTKMRVFISALKDDKDLDRRRFNGSEFRTSGACMVLKGSCIRTFQIDRQGNKHDKKEKEKRGKKACFPAF